MKRPKFISNLEQTQAQKILESATPTEKKKLVGELAQEIQATGQEDEAKATEAVKEIGAERDNLARDSRDRQLEALLKKTKYSFLDYKRMLAEEIANQARLEEFPPGWQGHVAVTDQGVVFYLKAPQHKVFARAFAPTNKPDYDLTAIAKILESAWVVIREYEKEPPLIEPASN